MGKVVICFLLGISSAFYCTAALSLACYEDYSSASGDFCQHTNFRTNTVSYCALQYEEVVLTVLPDGCPVREDLLGVCRRGMENNPANIVDVYFYHEPSSSLSRDEHYQHRLETCTSAGRAWYAGGSAPELLGPGDMRDEPVARADCGAGSSPVDDSEVATCGEAGDAARAEVDVGNASIKVIAATLDGLEEGVHASGQLLDLVTITRGFDGSGYASGTVTVEIDGMVDPAPGNRVEVGFTAVLWYPDEAPPGCISDVFDCGLFGGRHTLAEFEVEVLEGEVLFDTDNGRGGTPALVTVDPADLRAGLTLPWTVRTDRPSFYVGVFGIAEIPPGVPGLADFSDSVTATVTGPEGFAYSGRRGLAATAPDAEQATEPVRLTGSIRNAGGQDLSALVLASGRVQYSNEPLGYYDLEQLPREGDGSVHRQIYADGFVPGIDVVRGSTAEPVVLASSGQCPNYNPPGTPVPQPESAGQRHRLSGKVFVQDTAEPVVALVLVNGEFGFSDTQGNYELEFPLDGQGQFTRQVYASGFAPSVESYDASTTYLDVRLARAGECN